jgi:uncharacterized protein (DUF1697 family)
MNTYVALLRGINVGGKRRVPMDELQAVAESIGFRSVSTYIQSGNLLFESDRDETGVCTQLAKAIAERFGFDVPVIARSSDDFLAVAESHPFSDLDLDPRFLHVGFLDRLPTAEPAAAIPAADFAPDRIVVHGRDVYLAYPNGSARSRLTVPLLESRLGASLTARNWKTVRRLADLVGSRLG